LKHAPGLKDVRYGEDRTHVRLTPMDNEFSAAALQRLIGINKSVLGELVARGIVKRGDKRGTYVLEASVSD
jgi:hypothetical protein